MKQKIRNVAVFLCAFSVIFFSIQNILLLHYGTNEMHGNDIQELKKVYDIYQKNDGKIDVCFVGSSPVYTGISPAVLWGERGITSVNLGMINQTAVVSYFQVKTLIEIHKPKVIVLDMCSLFDARKADDVYQRAYIKSVEVTPIHKIKSELIHTIVKDNDNQDTISYYFPFLKLHDQWSQIRPAHLISCIHRLPGYFRGGMLTRGKYHKIKLPDGYADTVKKGQVNTYSLGYYEMLFDLCHENGVKVLAINMPKNEMSWTGEKLELCKAVCEQNNVNFIDFNSSEELKNLAFNQEEDYYDQGHLAVRGNFKFSKVLAQKIAELYNLEDHRNDPNFADWQQDYIDFCKDYRDVIESLSD